ncbi:MAG TPA: flavodoxin domain-containing protein [Bacilli bacterium]|nr:MAG: protoporphyrinogen oxidase [Tenericutes bacterium ADurb.BinA124]HNZ50254.1 flavodoxin domain-containing protein [Bacilli bacterium]HPX84117.1 flavodoxin domain-containing protein [Bacilli bacterium]HQC75066.1 flavodoxin domain-containing protein [Bacilli bacterium]
MNNTLIIYGTKFNSTKKVAEIIKDKTPNSTIMSKLEFRKLKNLNDYSRIIIGTNVIMGTFNGAIKKFIRKHHKVLITKTVYGFILGSNIAMAAKYEAKLQKITNAKQVVFVGGIINPTLAKGLYKKMMEGVLLSLKENKQPVPSINYSMLNQFINRINHE